MGEMSTVRAADHRSFDSLSHFLDRVVFEWPFVEKRENAKRWKNTKNRNN